MPKQKKEIRIGTLVPTRGLIFTETLNSILVENARCNQYPVILTTKDLPIPDCRNALVEDALKHPAYFTHFLLVDDDVVIPDGGLEEMLKLDADIAFIDYPMHHHKGKWANMGTACYDNWLPGEDWEGKPVVWAGLGCTLVKREVFEKMEKPWFKEMSKSFVRDKKGKVSFTGEFPNPSGGGEDVYFFLQARKNKMKIAQVKGMVAKHLRIERFVLVLSSDKYKTQHTIKGNEKITQPYK